MSDIIHILYRDLLIRKYILIRINNQIYWKKTADSKKEDIDNHPLYLSDPDIEQFIDKFFIG